MEPEKRNNAADVIYKRVGRAIRCPDPRAGNLVTRARVYFEQATNYMIFQKTTLHGAFVIEPERLADERGFFARSFCANEFKAHGLNPCVAQCNISHNARKGTLRGMHFQIPPCAEAKLVRCTRGAIYDVIVDMRSGSPTYKSHVGIRLDESNRLMLYIPEGFAHGFLTLEDDTEIFYQMSEFYSPQHASGFRWNDPYFDLKWSDEITVISERDRSYPDFKHSR
jgi:dTDP-4-dehydrorhamnose 3,5-epimerase